MFEKKEHQNSGTLGKDTIIHWIISFLSVEKRFSFNKGAQPDVYFDEELYKNRFKIGWAEDWLDGYKDLIMRYNIKLNPSLFGKSSFYQEWYFYT